MLTQPVDIDEDEAAEAAADAVAIAELDAGRFVSWEAVKPWMLSWGTDHELPQPQVGD